MGDELTAASMSLPAMEARLLCRRIVITCDPVMGLDRDLDIRIEAEVDVVVQDKDGRLVPLKVTGREVPINTDVEVGVATDRILESVCDAVAKVFGDGPAVKVTTQVVPKSIVEI